MPDRPALHILIVDDHTLVRIGIRHQLSGDPRITVVGEAESAADAVRLVMSLTPDVVILDLNLPDGSGIDACRRILLHSPATRVLIMSVFDEAETVQAAMTAGAQGYVLKDITGDMLRQAVHTVAGGGSFLCPRLVRSIWTGPPAEASQALSLLSRQERRILPLLAEGKTNKEIGAVLALSEKTVKNYLANMFVKLQITRRTQAVALYLRGRRTAQESDVSMPA